MNELKAEFLEMIDAHKNQLLRPVEMLHWTWLRVFILSIPDDDFARYTTEATRILSK